MSDEKIDELIKAQKQNTNTMKNGCGCLILILLAPLWIPVLLGLIGSL